MVKVGHTISVVFSRNNRPLCLHLNTNYRDIFFKNTRKHAFSLIFEVRNITHNSKISSTASKLDLGHETTELLPHEHIWLIA